MVAGNGKDSGGPHLFKKSTSLFDDKSYCWILKSFNHRSTLKIAFVCFKKRKKNHSIQVALQCFMHLGQGFLIGFFGDHFLIGFAFLFPCSHSCNCALFKVKKFGQAVWKQGDRPL